MNLGLVLDRGSNVWQEILPALPLMLGAPDPHETHPEKDLANA